jgi:hypothetical protein
VNISAKTTPRRTDGLSRIFAAAVVNRQFCQMLLQDPYAALQRGYLGETFVLSEEEMDAIVSIRADSLSDFARQLNSALSQ